MGGPQTLKDLKGFCIKVWVTFLATYSPIPVEDDALSCLQKDVAQSANYRDSNNCDNYCEFN